MKWSTDQAASPLDDRLQAGLGPGYTVERELGRGGMATVYLARDTKHGRQVALKVLHADLAASLGPERFRREIAFAATLQHPHILTVLDSGETASGQLWFTMPYVQGETLRERIRREHQLPLDDALRITREVAGALDYAHRQGVVHRDIKPENILLTADGNALVADFGIARALSPSATRGAGAGSAESRPGAPGTDRAVDTALTETGLAVGTPQYMSPEQAAGDRDVGPRSDVYSLGTVLYEMLAGEPPFTGPNAQAIIAQMLSGEAPSIRRARPSVPEWVDAALRKALATVAVDRFATAGEFARAIDPATHGVSGALVGGAGGAGVAASGATTAHAPRTPPRRFPVAALSLVLGLLIGGGALFAWRSHEHTGATPAAPVRIAVLPFENVGDSTHAYFADGLTDALRGKLAIVPNVLVIARGSSSQYRGSTKPEDQIGHELGVQYLLMGRVRWAKDRVEISPELVDVSDGKSATTKWEQQYDTTLTDVFGVQSSIAGQVAKSLGTTLGAGDRAALAATPTTSTEAYDAYLRGYSLMLQSRYDQPELGVQAIGDLKLAVSLDSMFAQAWAVLGGAEAVLERARPSPELKRQARADIDRALALQPNLAHGHLALAVYYSLDELDIGRADDEIALARRADSNNVDVLSFSAQSDLDAGHPEVAIRHLQRAQSIDPRSTATITELAQVLNATGRYDEAERELEHGLAIDSTHDLGLYWQLWSVKLRKHDYDGARAVTDRVLRVAPSTVTTVVRLVETFLVTGDLAGARAAVATLPPGVDRRAVAAYLSVGDDLYWVLDERSLASLMALPADEFIALAGRGTLRRDWSLLHAHVAALHGDTAGARAWGDTAVRDGRLAAEETPKSDEAHYLLGVALAYSGRADEARHEMHLGLALDSAANAYYPLAEGYARVQRARVFMLLNEPDSAVAALDQVLHANGAIVTPAWLRIDPTWAPLRKYPAFQRLVNSDRPIA